MQKLKNIRKRPYWLVMLVLAVLIVGLNLAGFSTAFCDAFTDNAYPILTAPLSYLCSLAGVCVGELLMYAAIIAVIAALLLLIALIFARKRKGYRHFLAGYFKTLLAVLLCGLLLFTLNWSIPVRATSLRTQLGADQTFTLAQMQELRDSIIEGLNTAAEEAPRDEDGNLVYSDDTDAKVATALDELGEEFPRLSGYYPAPKTALCSDILEWMDIGGYTYPYTQEIIYNRYVSQLYYPLLGAHERVHHKGYFLESDAEFLSFIALSRSEDAILRYSAYESMYYYVEKAYINALMANMDSAEATATFNSQVQLSDQVVADITADREQRQETYDAGVNQQAQEALSGAAEQIAQTGWSTQSQLLQENSYSGVVGLLLAYYE